MTQALPRCEPQTRVWGVCSKDVFLALKKSEEGEILCLHTHACCLQPLFWPSGVLPLSAPSRVLPFQVLFLSSFPECSSHAAGPVWVSRSQGPCCVLLLCVDFPWSFPLCGAKLLTASSLAPLSPAISPMGIQDLQHPAFGRGTCVHPCPQNLDCFQALVSRWTPAPST